MIIQSYPEKLNKFLENRTVRAIIFLAIAIIGSVLLDAGIEFFFW